MLRISKTLEKIIVLGVIFLGLFITLFPALYNYLNTPENLFYSGQTSWFDAWDINTYVSYIRYGQKYGVFLQNTYAHEPHSGVFVFQVYTILGLINRLLNLNPFLLYHLASVIVGIMLIAVIYFSVKTFLEKSSLVLSALLISALGAGFGWLSNLSYSIDYRLAGFTLINDLEKPHNGLSTLLLISGITFFALYLDNGKLKYFLYSLLFAFLIFTIHPPFALYFVLIFFFALLLFGKKVNIKKSIILLALLLFLYLIYFLIIFLPFINNPGFRGIVGQKLWQPDVPSLAAGFGFLTLGIIYAVLTKTADRKINFLKLVFIIQLTLALFPFGFQLYYFKAIFVFGTILAIYAYSRFVSSKYIPFVLVLIILFSLPLRIKIFSYLMKPNYHNPFYFLNISEGKALQYMSTFKPGKTVLSLYVMGNFIPAYTDNRVYLGHRYQTPDFQNKVINAQAFYQGKLEDSVNFLYQNRIDYVYIGFEERNIIGESKSANLLFSTVLKPVFTLNAITIYKVE